MIKEALEEIEIEQDEWHKSSCVIIDYDRLYYLLKTTIDYITCCFKTVTYVHRYKKKFCIC